MKITLDVPINVGSVGNTEQDVIELLGVVQKLISSVAKHVGEVTYDPEVGVTLPSSTTVHSQLTDKIYCTQAAPVAVGDYVHFNSASNTHLECYLAVGSEKVHGFVVDIFPNNIALVALKGVNTNLSGLAIGIEYRLSTNLPGKIVIGGTGELVGVAVSATDLYMY